MKNWVAKGIASEVNDFSRQDGQLPTQVLENQLTLSVSEPEDADFVPTT